MATDYLLVKYLQNVCIDSNEEKTEKGEEQVHIFQYVKNMSV